MGLLDGKTAIVTGAARGIGVNITALLAYYEFLENLLWCNAVSNTHTR